MTQRPRDVMLCRIIQRRCELRSTAPRKSALKFRLFNSQFNFITGAILFGAMLIAADGDPMPEELLIILAAEAVLLVFVTAMTLHVGRMDVLKGRSLKRAPGALTRNMRSQGSIGARVRDSMRLTGRWPGVARSKIFELSRRPGPIRGTRTNLRTKVRSVSCLWGRLIARSQHKTDREDPSGH
jgi:hypothetical protein